MAKIFHFGRETILALSRQAGCAELTLRLFLQGAMAVDQAHPFAKQETTAYEFVSQVFFRKKQPCLRCIFNESCENSENNKKIYKIQCVMLIFQYNVV